MGIGAAVFVLVHRSTPSAHRWHVRSCTLMVVRLGRIMPQHPMLIWSPSCPAQGHSLGGSLATLLVLMYLRRGVLPPVAVSPVYTFGAPAVFCEGDCACGIDDGVGPGRCSVASVRRSCCCTGSSGPGSNWCTRPACCRHPCCYPCDKELVPDPAAAPDAGRQGWCRVQMRRLPGIQHGFVPTAR